VLSPLDTAAQTANWRALKARLAARADGAWLRVVDLCDVDELYDPANRLDGWNFGAEAIGRSSEVIAPAFLDLIPSR
jgi:hypothetical protein